MQITNQNEALGRIKGIADFIEAFAIANNEKIFKEKSERLMLCAEYIQKHLEEIEKNHTEEINALRKLI